MKYITFIPLIGGMAIANAKAVGHKPEFVLSYDAFGKNESNLKNYWPDVDWHLLDDDTNELVDEDFNPDYSDIDFVSAVCPCAGMSGLNCATRSADNATNNWVYKSAEYILGTIKPKVYFGENAPGLYSEQNVKVLNKLREYGKQYGYSFTIYKTDTYRHGIPQHRFRTFYFFWKGNTCPVMDWYNHPSELPFEEWILDKNVGTQTTPFKNYGTNTLYPEMQWIMETRCNNDYKEYVKFFHELCDSHSVRSPYDYIKEFNLWQEYRDWLENYPDKDKPMHDHGRQTPWHYINYRWDKIKRGLGYFAIQPVVYKGATNAIISKNMLWTLHPTENRYLSTREVMSMMGLPSDFELITNNLQQVTQNVPVCTAHDMTEQVIKFINGELKNSPYAFIKQNNMTQKIDAAEFFEPELPFDEHNTTLDEANA